MSVDWTANPVTPKRRAIAGNEEKLASMENDSRAASLPIIKAVSQGFEAIDGFLNNRHPLQN
jgi:hypothetical protein